MKTVNAMCIMGILQVKAGEYFDSITQTKTAHKVSAIFVIIQKNLLYIISE